jgi:hypothetical protein
MLRWEEEGNDALICDDEPLWLKIPLAGPEQSVTSHRGVFRLLADGTLEGEVKIQHTGHSGVTRRRFYAGISAREREEHVRELVRQRIDSAEIRDIRFESLTDQVKPLAYSFHVRVPAYAQRTGRRLFVQPAFFQRGVAPLFPTSKRTLPVYFHYPWSEQDDVEIELPPGFSLEDPGSLVSRPLENEGEYRARLKVNYLPAKRTLIYERRFDWGRGGRILFPADVYPRLKTIFDFVHREDNHTIALKQDAIPQE